MKPNLSMIADRGLKLAGHGINLANKLDIMMDLESAHQQHPLDLERFYKAKNADFIHDFFGIITHMDRSEYPGTLTDSFLPRFTKGTPS